MRVETILPERFCPRSVSCHHSSSLFGIIHEKDSVIQRQHMQQCCLISWRSRLFTLWSLLTEASGALDAGVGYHADENDFLDPMLCELGVKIGIGEAALCPVLKHDDVASAGAELGMELSAPRSGGE